MQGKAREFLAQTGLALDRRKFLLILAALSIVLFFAWGMAIGRGASAFALAIITALLAILVFLRGPAADLQLWGEIQKQRANHVK